MGQTSNMMLDTDNYMKSLVETTEELSNTRAQEDIEAEIRGLQTCIRNLSAASTPFTRQIPGTGTPMWWKPT